MEAISFMPQPLYSQKRSPSYSLDRRLGGLQSWPECSVKGRKSLPLLGIRPGFAIP